MLLSGCMTTQASKHPANVQETQNPQTTARIQTTARAPATRPAWVNAPPQSTTRYYAAGYGRGASKAESTQKAIADARENISRWMATKVRSTQISHTDSNGDSFISISQQTANSTITGIKQEALWADGDDGVWVLLSIPRQSAAYEDGGTRANE